VTEIGKHLGDLGTFGIFALMVLYMVFKYVVPVVKGTTQPASTPPSEHTTECREAVSELAKLVGTLTNQVSAIAAMVRELHGGISEHKVNDNEEKLFRVGVQKDLATVQETLTKINERLIEYNAATNRRGTRGM
jgi:hypothetical protein